VGVQRQQVGGAAVQAAEAGMGRSGSSTRWRWKYATDQLEHAHNEVGKSFSLMSPTDRAKSERQVQKSMSTALLGTSIMA
jgi:hypothetical protein